MKVGTFFQVLIVRIRDKRHTLPHRESLKQVKNPIGGQRSLKPIWTGSSLNLKYKINDIAFVWEVEWKLVLNRSSMKTKTNLKRYSINELKLISYIVHIVLLVLSGFTRVDDLISWVNDGRVGFTITSWEEESLQLSLVNTYTCLNKQVPQTSDNIANDNQLSI